MQALPNTIKMSDLRKNTEEVVENVQKSKSVFLLIARSKPVMMLMSCQVYQQLENRMFEDIDTVQAEKSLDFFINFAKNKSGKNRADAVKLVRNLR